MHRRNLLTLSLVGTGTLFAGCAPTDKQASPSPTGPRRHAYGDDPSQFFETSKPNGDPRGTVVVIHGGFWSSQYGIEYGRPLAADLVERGWNVTNLEYRRVGAGPGGGGGTPETFDDVAAALDAVPSSGLDLAAGPVIALGHSAGGHLAAWAATRKSDRRWAGGLDLDAVVSQAGVLDLVAASEAGLGGGAVERLLGHAPGAADAPYDPIQRPALGIPVLCVHDEADTVVPLAQSSAYVETVARAGGDAKLVTVAGDHFTLIDPSSDAWARQLKLLDGLV